MSVKHCSVGVDYQAYQLYEAAYTFTVGDGCTIHRGKSLVWACNVIQVQDRIKLLFNSDNLASCSVKLCATAFVNIAEYGSLLYCEQLQIVKKQVVAKSQHRYIGMEVEILISAWEMGFSIGSMAIVVDVISDSNGGPIAVVVDQGTKNENEGFPGLRNTSIQTMYIDHVRLPK